MEAPIHLDSESLGQYRDGEPVVERRIAIEAHLKSCEWCGMEFHRIRSTPGAVEPRTRVPQRDAEGISSLLEKIRDWESRIAPGFRGPAIRSRVAREISLYVGGNAARELIQPIADDAGNLLPIIQPLLGRFLGRKAASHLSSHIIEVAVVRR